MHPTALKKPSLQSIATEYLIAHQIFAPVAAMHHIYDINGKNISMEQLLKGDTKDVWKKSTSNEFG